MRSVSHTPRHAVVPAALRVGLTGLALSLTGPACTGRLQSRTHDPMRSTDAGALVDATGRGAVDAAAPPGALDAWGPVAIDAASCSPGDARSSAVYYGTREDSTLMLTPGQVLAIVRVELGGGLCSGAVIAPRWVLTAAHCEGGGGSVFMGANPDRLDHEVRFSRWVTHPSLDLMLLQLDADATVAVPGLTPLPIYPSSLATLGGRTAEAAGYGQTEAGSTGARRFTAEPIVEVSSQYVSIDGMGRRGVCFGDSGGPLMLRDGGRPYVLGALSNGDGSCVGVDNYTRVDQGRAWIESNVGPIDPPPPDPCMGETLAGRCDGTTAVWCEGGAVRRRACGLCGQRCGDVPSVGGAYCL